MQAPLSPLPPTVADRDAEIAALQTAFDEYIASSRELEDELDAELAKMQEKLAESSGANAALIAQLENLNPQLSQLERAVSDTKRKLEAESTARRQAELAQDEAEARAREAEGSLEALRAESDQVHEQLVFREEEVEEMRLELEVEKERHSVELEELAAQVAVSSKKSKGGQKSEKDERKDDISVMSEDDFVTMAVGSADGVANDDNEDYIKRLEDELEDVTEQLIEAETNISNMEGKLNAAEKNKTDLEQKVSAMTGNIEELQANLETSAAKAVAKEENDTNRATSEELELLTEELALTQEELKAAEEDAKIAGANLEKSQIENKAEITKLKASLQTAQNEVNNAKAEVETMEQALNEANTQTTTLRDEVENLMQALKNAKQDHEKTLEDMEALRQAFDETEGDIRMTSVQHEEDLAKEHKRELQDLSAEVSALTEANKALKAARAKETAGPSASEVDLQIKLDQKQSELERIRVDFREAKDNLIKSKRKIEELSAGNKALINGAFDSPKKRNEILSSPLKKETFDRFTTEEEVSAETAFYRSHARTRSRVPHEPTKRARSSSPSTVVRLERELGEETKRVKTITQERDSLKSQQRMNDVRVQHLEADVSKLHQKVEEANQKSDNLVSVVAGVSQNPEAREDKEFMDTEIESLIKKGDKEMIAEEFRALARKSTLQKEHNAQLLIRILKLQGNIQVCCRIRPMTNGEIKRNTKRVVEPLSDSEVGVFDERTKSWKSYAYDKVWGPDSHQLGIFQDVEPLALSVVDGYNACIFAYGQTGSGKTYTMEGGQGIDRGISFRTIEKVFNLLQYRVIKQDALIQQYNNGDADPSAEKPGKFSFSINVGMLEIYNDNVHDLLVKQDKKNPKKKKSLEIKRDKEGTIVVAGLTKEPLHGLKDVVKLLLRGNDSRATAATDLNEHSSRSHMVLTVEVKSGIEGQEPTTGTLYLVDLAGSERVRKSAVEGQELKEATHINKSLSALGNVMEALDRKASHVPYRDSKLTYLLQDSLGGNSRTMMVVAVCPTSVTSDETSHALQFATRVRRINIGSAKRNVMSKNLEQTVKDMSQQLRSLAKSKEKSEQQLKSLKRDHTRIQERLRSSSESRAKSIDEGRTLAVLKTSNTQMTARWQKEKQMHEKTVADLESAQNDTKQVQAQLSKAKREIEKLAQVIKEKEGSYEALKGDLRKAKDASSAANLRARKAQMLQSRNSNVGPKAATNIVKPSTSRRGGVSGTPNRNIEPEEARSRVLGMLKEHDPSKVDKIDAIMERFKGREAFLLVKMSARYEGDNASQNSSSNKSTSNKSTNGGAAQKRSEMALARHMERMRSKAALQE